MGKTAFILRGLGGLGGGRGLDFLENTLTGLLFFALATALVVFSLPVFCF